MQIISVKIVIPHVQHAQMQIIVVLMLNFGIAILYCVKIVIFHVEIPVQMEKLLQTLILYLISNFKFILIIYRDVVQVSNIMM